MSNNNPSNFPRFPATGRISHRETRSLSSLLGKINNNNNNQQTTTTNSTVNAADGDDLPLTSRSAPPNKNKLSTTASSSPKMILPPMGTSNNHHRQLITTPTNGISSPTAVLFKHVNNNNNNNNNNVDSSNIANNNNMIVSSPSSSQLLLPPSNLSVPLIPSTATTQNLVAVAASILCDVTTKYSNASFSSNDQDAEQQRRQFFRVVEKVSKEAENSRSATVFCETLFLHVKQQIDSLNAMAITNNNSSNATSASADDFAGLRIASACWALDVISRSNTSFSPLLQDIKKLLFPSIFVGFNAVDEICKATGKTNPGIAQTTALITSAPYLVCDLFYQRHAKDQRKIKQLYVDHESRTQKLRLNKNGAGMIVRTLNRQIVGKVFKSWRGYCKRIRIERFARAILAKHGSRESRSSKLESAFSRWKLMVEQNRNATLSERCHHLTNQLENAKGQFQLQCFRADKYLRVVEELREELRSARDTREELHKENIRLQAQLESIQVQARERLEAHVSLLCGEIHRWRTWVRNEDRSATERTDFGLQFCDRRVLQLMAQAKTTRDQLLDQDNIYDHSNNGSNSASNDNSPNTNSLHMFENAEEEASYKNGMGLASLVNNAGSNVSQSSRTEAALLQWCSWCQQQCPLASVRAVTNFSTDFISGEVLIIIMNVAAPHNVSLGLLQDIHPIRRIERALEMGRKAGLTNLPKASDFAEGSADLVVLAVSEIFHLWASKQRLIDGDGDNSTPDGANNNNNNSNGKNNNNKNSKSAGSRTKKSGKSNSIAGEELLLSGTMTNNNNTITSEENNNNNEDQNEDGEDDDDDDNLSETASQKLDKPPVVTASELPRYLDECNTALDHYKANKNTVVEKDRVLWKLELSALFRGAYIAKERQEGRQVTVLDRKDMIRFTKFQKNRFSNLQNRYRMPPLDYSGAPWMHFELQLDLLRESLHNFYPDLRRCFTYYCNGSSTMASPGYWGFCNDIRAADGRTITRTHLDRIFVMANLEDVSHASVDPTLSFEDDLINEAEAADDEENSETLLIPSEFVECLIRIADLKVPSKMIHDKFNTLMKEFVNPFACKSETDKFRREINSTAIVAVTDRFKKDLSKIFVHFSHRRAGVNSNNKARFMSEKDFVFFARESMLYSSLSLDEASISQIFQNVASPTDDMTARELQAHEFMDALVCVSFYKVPSPFIPLEKKIETTILNLLNYLRGRLKGLVSLSKAGASAGLNSNNSNNESSPNNMSAANVLLSGSPLLSNSTSTSNTNNNTNTTNV